MLWLVSNAIISLPPKWSAETIAGPSIKGRDRHYVDGSALVRDPKHQPSRHALAKIAKTALDPRSHEHTTQALISCMGTINIETDSVRKYTADQYKHGQKSKAKVQDTKTSKKLQPKRRLTTIDESQDESLSENGQAPTKRKRKHIQKMVRKEDTQADSDEDSVSSADCKSQGKKPRKKSGTTQGTSKARGGRTRGEAVKVKPHGLPLSREHASAKYVKVLGMHTVSRGDKVDIIRLLMQQESDTSLRALLEDFLADDKCDLDHLQSHLEGAD
jgi:hypothetical protein